MRIGLLTIHWANNPGASLQAFAARQVLQQYGSVDTIDYRSPKPALNMTLVRVGATPRALLRAGKDLLRLQSRARVIRRFVNFSKLHLSLTKCVRDSSELRDLAQSYDALVVGSDQVWNPLVLNERGTLDPTYFLDFATAPRKLSLSSSMGSFRPDPQLAEMYRVHLGEFHALSVREADAAAFLAQLLGRPVEWTLDPTLLLDQRDWGTFTKINPGALGTTLPPTPFSVAYLPFKDSFSLRTARRVRDRLQLPMLVLDQDPLTVLPGSMQIRDAGPLEFLQAISRAAFMVTNSFHGVAFALNFRVPFLACRPGVGANRVESLLSRLRLGQLLVDSDTLERDLLRAIDDRESPAGAGNLLDAARTESLAYLRRALS